MNTPTIGLSFIAGLLSFLSPCVLPLLPSYLSYVSGATLSQMREDAAARRAVFMNTLLFVAGFSVVFVALGVLFSGSALLFPNATRIINIVAGTIVIVLGLNIIFDLIKVLNLEAKFHLSNKPRGAVGSFIVGIAFAAGWTPCIGPILTGILFLAGTSGNVAAGVGYLAIYSAGLAVPFLLTALFFGSATTLFAKIKRHFLAIRIVSGSLLVVVGVLIAAGRFQELNIRLVQAASSVSVWSHENPSASRALPAIALTLAAILSLLPTLRRILNRRAGRVHSAPAERIVRPYGTSIAGIFLFIAVLQATNVIDMISLVSSWLAFQGI